jgi:hypothetical protein
MNSSEVPRGDDFENRVLDNISLSAHYAIYSDLISARELYQSRVLKQWQIPKIWTQHETYVGCPHLNFLFCSSL